MTPHPTPRTIKTTNQIPTTLTKHYAHLTGITQIILFGSCTQPPNNTEPRDVDIILIGIPHLHEIHQATKKAEQTIGLPINPIITNPTNWHKPKRGLLRRIQKHGNHTTIWPPPSGPQK